MAMEEGALAKVKLVAAVVVLEMLIAGFHVVSRAALDMGVSKMAFLVYRNGSALLVIAPVAYFLEKKDRPPLTLRLMIDFFMLAAVGVTFTQGLYILGLYYLSPTYVSVIQNSVPAITFVMAAVLRIEQVNIKIRHGLAKIAGTVITIAGATIITLYKGMPLTTTHSEGTHKLKDVIVILSPRFTWIAGCLIMFVNCLCLSGWMVLQVPVLKKYPAKLSSFTITMALGFIQLVVVAPFFESNIERWKIHSGGELLTILYAGIVVLGIAWYIMIWCINKGGPHFVSVFQPLQTVMVAIMASIFLGDRLYIGGVIGAVVIVAGLYCVLWAKSKETKSNGDLLSERSLAQNLLHEESYIMIEDL
ncbi:auxin-induced protein 5NG4-like [Miscanthus floridulus]|uniref:auxin-induced protein 5NG4-like n=1 Tax=Miscanthus floridulus TaxID=154761 RepID=UPI0034595DBA